MSAFRQGSGDVFGPVVAVSGNIPLFDGTSGKIIKDGIPPDVLSALPRGYLTGLSVANNVTDATNDLNVAAGDCRDDSNSANIRLAIPLTKQLDVAWAAGTNQGGRDTGAIVDGTWHIFAIAKADGTSDVLMSLSLTAPTMPSGFIYKRRIRSITRVSGVIRPFWQLGDYIEFHGGEVTHGGAAAIQNSVWYPTLGTLVPSGIKFLCNIQVQHSHSTSGSYSYAFDPDVLSRPMMNMYTYGAGVNHPFNLQIVCRNDAKIRIDTGPQAGTFYYEVTAMGYWDFRDK